MQNDLIMLSCLKTLIAFKQSCILKLFLEKLKMLQIIRTCNIKQKLKFCLICDIFRFSKKKRWQANRLPWHTAPYLSFSIKKVATLIPWQIVTYFSRGSMTIMTKACIKLCHHFVSRYVSQLRVLIDHSSLPMTYKRLKRQVIASWPQGCGLLSYWDFKYWNH